MLKSKNKKISGILYLIIMLSVLTAVYSCEKKEPAVKPNPDEIMGKISISFPEISEPVFELYTDEKNDPIDFSKIEKYLILKSKENPVAEVGIFKLYDKINADYVKKIAQARILKMQGIYFSHISNDAEIRSYGNYVYYVSHSQKDKIFEIIENALRGV